MINAKTLSIAVLLLAATSVQAGEGKQRPKYDLDGDGVVTTEELNQRHQEKFKSMDLNGDGAVTLEEMETHKAKMREKYAEKHAEKRKQYFDKMDSDGDGKISAEEHAAKTAKMSAELDQDGDGEISRKEFRQMMKKHHKGGEHKHSAKD